MKETGGKGSRRGLAISTAISLCSQQNSEKIMHEESVREALSVRVDTKRRPERLHHSLLSVLHSLLKWARWRARWNKSPPLNPTHTITTQRLHLLFHFHMMLVEKVYSALHKYSPCEHFYILSCYKPGAETDLIGSIEYVINLHQIPDNA